MNEVPRLGDKIVAFTGKPVDAKKQKRISAFIGRYGFPVESIHVTHGESFNGEGNPIIEPTTQYDIILAEPITLQERYRLLEGLEHDPQIDIPTQQVMIPEVIVGSLGKENYDSHAQQLVLRIREALKMDYTTLYTSPTIDVEKLNLIKLVKAGRVRRIFSGDHPLILEVPYEGEASQQKILRFAEQMDTYQRIVNVRMKRNEPGEKERSIFGEARGGIMAHK